MTASARCRHRIGEVGCLLARVKRAQRLAVSSASDRPVRRQGSEPPIEAARDAVILDVAGELPHVRRAQLGVRSDSHTKPRHLRDDLV